MKENRSKSKDVHIRVLLEKNSEYLKIGDFVIGRYSGDILYTPSTRKIILDLLTEVIHFSWHKSGRVHVKLNVDKHVILERGELETISTYEIPTRHPIHKVGYQYLLKDIIVAPSKLPKFNKKRGKQDIVLQLREYKGPIFFLAAIVSGRLLVKKFKGQESPLEMINFNNTTLLLDGHKLALGHESGNADKILQLILFKYERPTENIKTGRRISIPRDQKITND